MSQISESPDLLREIADDLLADAEWCYRLARATLGVQAHERLLDFAMDFEERAEAARQDAPAGRRLQRRLTPTGAGSPKSPSARVRIPQAH